MKANSSQATRPRSGGIYAAILAAVCIQNSPATITVDGVRTPGTETEYSVLEVQPFTSAFGSGNALANIHAGQTGKLLNLFLGGRANDNAMIVFIDSKAGGVSSITKDLIRSGGFESDINNLAPDSGTGMTFENGFLPDCAIRIYGNSAEAYASYYDLTKRIRVDLGRVDNATASHGPVTGLRTLWTDVGGSAASYANAVNGVEIGLNMALLGVSEGNQNVKVMALLVNSSSTYGSNQSLGALGTDAVMAENVRTFNFQAESGTQTLTIPVNRPALVPTDDEDGDGLPNSSDPFPTDQTRDITFSVNMKVEASKGYFDPPSAVKAQFFSGSQPELSELTLTDPDGDYIYTGTLTSVKGFSGDSFGTYKFTTNDPQNTNGGYEYGFDRTFNLGPAVVAQNNTALYFSNQSTLTFAEWAPANADGQTLGQDFDGDGVKNGVEYFMGQIGSTFTANPSLVAGTVTWPKDPAFSGTYEVQTSPDLVTWTNVVPRPTPTPQNTIVYTPTGNGKVFTRLQVVVP
ncbi:MAG: hypothetical protein ABI600_03550 [Luteolibacter sp.]